MFKKWAQDYYQDEARQLADSDIEKAFHENTNKAYNSVYYCIYQNGEVVESSNPVKVSELEARRLSNNVISGVDNFIGFVDEEKNTLQFYSDEKGFICVDIPIVSEQGSQVGAVSYSEFRNLIETLEQPFIKYIELLRLRFQPW